MKSITLCTRIYVHSFLFMKLDFCKFHSIFILHSSFIIHYSFFNFIFLQNGETCLHAATISGNPELVQLLLGKTTTDDALLTNASGQNPLDLLIMFINYGNISLTSNLLKVRVLAFVRFHPLTLLKGCENASTFRECVSTGAAGAQTCRFLRHHLLHPLILRLLVLCAPTVLRP